MNFEYEDFYKFIASVGVGLVSLAVLVPWLFLREPFDLQLKQADLSALTPIAQSIIEQRQSLIQQIFTLIPYFSSIFFLLGFAMILFGGGLWWRKTQKIQDETQQVNLAILKQQLQTATKEEVEDVRKEEAKLEHTNPSVIDAVVNKAIAVEEKLVQKFTFCLSAAFDVLVNQRLGDVFFDIILFPKDVWTKGAIIELKYASREIDYEWLRRAALELSNKNRLYQLHSNNIPIPVLVVVASQKILSATDTQTFQQRIEQERIFRKGKSRIIFMGEEELEITDCSRLAELLPV